MKTSGRSFNQALRNYRTDRKVLGTRLPSNVSLSGETALNISVLKQGYAGQSYTGGGIISKEKFRYGYFQVQSKLTAGMALILLAYGRHGRTSYAPSAHTEIDVYEIDCDVPYGAPGVVRCKNVVSTRAMRITNPVSTRRMRSTGGNGQRRLLDTTSIENWSAPSLMRQQPSHDLVNVWLTATGCKPSRAFRCPALTV